MIIPLIPKFANTFDFFVKGDPSCNSTIIGAAVDTVDTSVVVVVAVIADFVVFVVDIGTIVDDAVDVDAVDVGAVDIGAVGVSAVG